MPNDGDVLTHSAEGLIRTILDDAPVMVCVRIPDHYCCRPWTADQVEAHGIFGRGYLDTLPRGLRVNRQTSLDNLDRIW